MGSKNLTKHKGGFDVLHIQSIWDAEAARAGKQDPLPSTTEHGTSGHVSGSAETDPHQNPRVQHLALSEVFTTHLGKYEIKTASL